MDSQFAIMVKQGHGTIAKVLEGGVDSEGNYNSGGVCSLSGKGGGKSVWCVGLGWERWVDFPNFVGKLLDVVVVGCRRNLSCGQWCEC